MNNQAKLIEVKNYIIERLQNNESGIDLLSQGWTVNFNKRLTRAIGRCHYTKKFIEMSLHFLPTLTEEEWKDTVNHEIAHALTPHSGHGIEWQRMAVKLGANPSATASLKVQPKSKYVITFKNTKGEYEFIQACNRKRNLSNSYLPGRKEETMGKLIIMPTEQFEFLSIK